MNDNFAEKFLQEAIVQKSAAFDISHMSAINLAYIGDAVFEILVRTQLLMHYKTSANEHHKSAKAFVRAGAQSAMYYKLLDVLTPEETAVMKRGRNAKSHSRAKNASVADYRHATGLEALFGYLYLTGNIDRVIQLFELCVQESE